ncbi:hypothetical protein EYF80_013009 [Liparis tanakae]|uniref:Uncharacterized protein n=1 Tax=Liparis tanakae TaxID=230148 RepID=A0A4Z2IFS3_9TELE|nr:hypothetical protein EYF80_013009 [Liparis tanakae]
MAGPPHQNAPGSSNTDTVLKWIVGMGQTIFMGSASTRQAFLLSQPAPSRGAAVWTLTLYCRADDCSTAVRNPLGNVKLESQNRLGGWAVSAQRANSLTRRQRSLVHAARGFSEGSSAGDLRLQGEQGVEQRPGVGDLARNVCITVLAKHLRVLCGRQHADIMSVGGLGAVMGDVIGFCGGQPDR